jgi:hypothetical protein
MNLEEAENKNYYAGEDQQQFTIGYVTTDRSLEMTEE